MSKNSKKLKIKLPKGYAPFGKKDLERMDILEKIQKEVLSGLTP